MTESLTYQSGFGNFFETEALAGALPRGQSNPQKCPFGLYAEQISGSAFTAPQGQNLRTWVYRTIPTVKHSPYTRCNDYKQYESVFSQHVNPNQMRWMPRPIPKTKTDFVAGLWPWLIAGSPEARDGLAIYLYEINQSMTNTAFSSADGDLLLVPQLGRLKLVTELGVIELEPLEIAVIPRGIIFRVEMLDAEARGYVCENFGQPFALPPRGVIGSNGLANQRDFLAPVAAFENRSSSHRVFSKVMGQLWQYERTESPMSVVAWHGNLYPYKYDLRKFCTMNTVSYDHPDPSIFTVLTSPSTLAGTANMDFAIFPPRWMVAENTFRLPWFHRNVMSEYMGLITGTYDAKEEGFVPGGGSLHNICAAHGPEADGFEKASQVDLVPVRYRDTMTFMFESRLAFRASVYAEDPAFIDHEYQQCWAGLKAVRAGVGSS